MQALVFSAVNEMNVQSAPDPVPATGEVLVQLKSAALNHRDLWIKLGRYAGLKWPCIPGSDGAGIVTAVGEGVDAATWVGREVIINPSFGWGDKEKAQGKEFSILGLPRDGTLAEQIAVPVKQLSAKPAHLSWHEAAALPLAGLTAWRALMSRARLQPGERVLISGIGGGVALFALQFAVAHGAEVWVTSSSAQKIARAIELGAKGGFDYAAADWAKRAVAEAGAFDMIIDGAGGPGVDALIDAAAPGARLAFYGATRGNVPELALRKIFFRQLSLLGSTMGSPADWQAMVGFVSHHQLKPIVSDTFPLLQAAEAFALMERGGQMGKVVVSL